jgi:ribosome-associated protein
VARKISTIAPKAEMLKALVTKSLEDSKAVDIICIPLKGKTDIADFMVIASGTSSRHIHAMANQLGEKISISGLTRFSTEGMGDCQWVLVDNPYVVVHLFMPEMRGRYNLEKMWSADFSDSTQSVKI